MTAGELIPLCLLVPAVAALLIPLFDRLPNLREAVTLTAAVILFALVLALAPDVFAGGRPEYRVLELMVGLTFAFEVEPLGMLFALIASFLWIVTTIYAIGYMRGHREVNQSRFYACFAIALASTMGVAFAGNMLTLFVFYEVLTISTFPLVTHHGTEEAKRAGRVYLGILLGTSIAFQLFAILWTWSAAGTLDFEPGGILAGKADGPVVGILLALYAFGIGKAALMPFHRWLPAAMVAPTPVSALLHAVAVVKAGVFTVLKVVIYIFGLDLTASTGASLALAYVAAATILIASLVAMGKDNLKARLAYSTISQLSYIVLAAMLATSLAAIGGAMHIAMHAFGKITLFFAAGAILVAAHKSEISDMRGLGRTMPLTFAAFFLASLSIIGLPPFGGMWSKWYIAMGAANVHQVIFIAVLMISSLLNIAYLLPVAVRGFMAPAEGHGGHGNDGDHGNDGHGHDDHGHGNPASTEPTMEPWTPRAGIREAPLPCLIAIGITTVGCVALFFNAEWLFAALAPIAGVAAP